MKYFELLNRIKSKEIDPLYHFTGEEDFLKEEAWRKISTVLVPEDLKSFNLDLLYGSETSAVEIISKVSTSPINSEKRLVVVFDLHKLSPFYKDVLLSYLPKLPDFTCLILTSPKLDDKAKKTKFYSTLNKLATTVDFPRLYDDKIPTWTEAKFREYGKKIAKEAVLILHKYVGNNLSDLASEIEKLVLYVGERESISSLDVESVVGLSKTYNIFQLNDAIGEKDCEKGLEILKNLFLLGEKPGTVIYRLAEHLERLIKTKNFVPQKGASLSSILKVHPYYAQKYPSQAVNFSQEELERGLVLLYQTDVDLKSSRMPDKIVMELLVYNLCHL
ncbi:MAG: DNA polymerase III subunit delta [candidate division Zixibacteria bacterium]|nr:DNA polymerase III subunit delta [candidate division Zixibacteria bacterium]